MALFRRKSSSEPERRQPNLMSGQDDFTFRRSRTLTGSRSMEVRSAAENRSRLKSSRIHLHDLRRHRRGVVFGLLTTFALIGLFAWSLGQFIQSPQEVAYAEEARLQQQPASETYLDGLQKYLAAHPVERFLFRLDDENLSNYMTMTYPEVKSANVESNLPGQFTLNISLREPLLSWKVSDKTIYVDKSGNPFSVNYFQAPKVKVDDQSGVDLPTGSDTITSQRFIHYIGQLVGKVNNGAGEKPVSKVIIPRGVTRQVDLIMSGESYPIKTSIDRGTTSQSADVLNALGYVQRKGIKPAYLDVRVPGKAYYR